MSQRNTNTEGKLPEFKVFVSCAQKPPAQKEFSVISTTTSTCFGSMPVCFICLLQLAHDSADSLQVTALKMTH